MQDRDRRPGEGDIRGPTKGDFTDWDNPEDKYESEEEREDAPEGYYEEEEPDDEGYIPTPDDADYDLSEEAGYSDWEPPARPFRIPQWVILALSLLLILSLLLPALIRFS